MPLSRPARQLGLSSFGSSPPLGILGLALGVDRIDHRFPESAETSFSEAGRHRKGCRYGTGLMAECLINLADGARFGPT
jgi:hypothetical protein